VARGPSLAEDGSGSRNKRATNSSLHAMMPASNPARQPILNQPHMLMQSRAGLIKAARVRQQFKGVYFQLGQCAPGILALSRV
jgi:hypothetical protein